VEVKNMLALRLDDELEKRVADLATRQGRNKSALVREALIRYMEDQEDIEMAEAALKNQSGKPTYSLAEVRRELGLED
jgi:RHH-type rel operon transcriptional repressor/antitoxin RelB